MKILKFSIFIAVLFFASAAIAQPQRGVGGGQWWKAPEVIEKMKLTEDQQKKIEALNEASQKEKTDLRSKLETQTKELEQQFSGADVDEKQFKKTLQELNATQNQMVNSQIMMKYSARKVLSKEQVEIALKEYPEIVQLRSAKNRPQSPGQREQRRPQMERGPGAKQERKGTTGAPAATTSPTSPTTEQKK